MTEKEEAELQRLLLKKQEQYRCAHQRKPDFITTIVGGAAYAVLTLGVGPLFDYLDSKD